jgi:hypothetical protein
MDVSLSFIFGLRFALLVPFLHPWWLGLVVADKLHIRESITVKSGLSYFVFFFALLMALYSTF